MVSRLRLSRERRGFGLSCLLGKDTRSCCVQSTLQRISFSAPHITLCVVFKETCVIMRQAMSFMRPCLFGMNP
ncbi:hypothetical protein S83_047600 [Arachis hypogaea]